MHVAVLALTAAWVLRTFQKEAQFHAEAAARAGGLSAAAGRSLVRSRSLKSGAPEVTFVADGTRAVAKPGATVLEIAEANGQSIEAGCRMGVCGADPIAVKEGMGNLSPVSDDERSTLDRLGHADNTRMACCCRVKGPVSVALTPDKAGGPTPSQILRMSYDQLDRARGRARQRDRGRHRRRPRAPPPSASARSTSSPTSRTRSTTAWASTA